ncbi:hypothetical protein HS088_TW03G00281 [Tripterygium wilfordii]|uniref:RING-type E3 ubiquitin transferase BRCA1 n=1 Tax=Tripterygium wilfordii TaxID=458696 RepID=A0A7J7DUW7_TRIWF|nr:hypothetical protein HS088_TW03G00281 [Tripterygium wilfordii]
MSKSITHLVCWKFEGKKYSLAKKFNTIILNHKWVVDCVKEGRRVEEHPYMIGKEVGLLLVEDQLVAKLALWTKNETLFSDKSNISSDSEKLNVDINLEDMLMLYGLWNDSLLLKERSRCNAHLLKEKAIVSDTFGSTAVVEPAYRGRRLVMKNFGRHKSESVLSHSDQERYPVGCSNRSTNTDASYNELVDESEFNVFEMQGASYGGLNVVKSTINNSAKEVEEIGDWNRQPALKDSKQCTGDSTSALKRTSEDYSDFGNLVGDIKDEKHAAGSYTATELSCVICWTEFSSTRGILPCGHRFCYPCIQNWADHMSSRREISTCSLCKAIFFSITKVEDAVTSDQNIYSQTIPCASSIMDIFILNDQERSRVGTEVHYVVYATIGNQKIFSLAVTCVRYDAYINTAWILSSYLGHAFTVRISKCSIVMAFDILA